MTKSPTMTSGWSSTFWASRYCSRWIATSSLTQASEPVLVEKPYFFRSGSMAATMSASAWAVWEAAITAGSTVGVGLGVKVAVGGTGVGLAVGGTAVNVAVGGAAVGGTAV